MIKIVALFAGIIEHRNASGFSGLIIVYTWCSPILDVKISAIDLIFSTSRLGKPNWFLHLLTFAVIPPASPEKYEIDKTELPLRICGILEYDYVW